MAQLADLEKGQEVGLPTTLVGLVMAAHGEVSRPEATGIREVMAEVGAEAESRRTLQFPTPTIIIGEVVVGHRLEVMNHLDTS
jgi:hypothetical protein